MDTQDNAGVIAPPPVLALGALLLGFGVNWIAPLYLIERIPESVRYGLSAALIVLALALFALAVSGLLRAGTALRTGDSTTRLVTAGIYAHVRNPIYVAFSLLLLGIAFAAAADWLIVFTLIFAIVIHYGVVMREERYLETKFSDEYRAYKARTPRYGWRF